MGGRPGYRTDNPAGDAISAALPNNAVVRNHQRALPHAEVGAALRRVRSSGAYRGTVLSFEFLVLTASRSGEVRNARWGEIDIDAAAWTIRAERMKTRRIHRVPLSSRALVVLDEAKRELRHSGDIVFPSPTGLLPRHHYMATLLRKLQIGAVPHGFRSSFRDWATECTENPREVCELALAHVNSDRVEATYRRSDLFERRRELMQQWDDYTPSQGSPLRADLPPRRRDSNSQRLVGAFNDSARGIPDVLASGLVLHLANPPEDGFHVVVGTRGEAIPNRPNFGDDRISLCRRHIQSPSVRWACRSRGGS